MLFKILPLIALIGIGIKILASIAAVRARHKQLQAQQAGRLDQYHADREAFWRNVDRACIVVIIAIAVWYVIAVLLWLF